MAVEKHKKIKLNAPLSAATVDNSPLAHCKHFAMECTSMLSSRFPDLPIFASLAVPALSDLVEPESVTRCSSASIATDS